MRITSTEDGTGRLTSKSALQRSGQLQSAVVALLAAFLVVLSPASLACGPFFPDAVFIQDSHPDLPFVQYAQGNLGVIRPSWARSYLVVAYRYLNDNPLNQEEQTLAQQLWYDRLLNQNFQDTGAVAAWQNARKAVTSEKTCDIVQDRNVSTATDQYQTYLNCPDDAFTAATEALKTRVTKYGATSPVVAEWLKAQDQVFCHCGSRQYNWKTNVTAPEPPFPAPLPDTADAAAKADRAYQIAAAHFYAQDFETARKEFEAIAADHQSPWSAIAPYLVARTLIRQATLATTMNTALLQQAEEKLKALAATNPPSSLQTAIKKLLSFIELRIDPNAQLRLLSAELQSSKNAADMRNNLYDYTQLFDNQLGIASEDPFEATKDKLVYAQAPPAVKADDMSDWILTFQSGDREAREHALQQYKKTGSKAWLVAALSGAAATHPVAGELVSKATAIDSNSPAYATLQYLSIQILKAQGKTAEAEKRINTLLAQKNLPPSSVNMVRDQLRSLARSFDEYLRLSMGRPAVLSSDAGGEGVPDDMQKVQESTTFQHLPMMFSDRYVAALNTQVPLALLVNAAQQAFEPGIHRNLVHAAWTRAFLLDDAPALKPMTPLLRKTDPALADLISAYEKAANAADRSFAGTFLLLRSPGMRPYIEAGVPRETPLGRIDDYGDNWWCATPPDEGARATDEPIEAKGEAAFLSPEQRTAGKAQYAKLKALGTAPTTLGATVIAYAKSHASDARVPEALALVVKASRFGCKDSQTTKMSRESFKLLHNKYPSNAWTKKTPYWY